MRISDWSSDVCSSDLRPFGQKHIVAVEEHGRADADRPPLDRRHERQATGGNRAEEAIDVARPVAGAGAGEIAHIIARRVHVAFAGDEDDPHLAVALGCRECIGKRSEEHTSELQSLMRISYAVFFLTKKTKIERKQLSTPINKQK